VVFPDVDTLARQLLLQELPFQGLGGIKVGTRLPSPVPDRFIQCFSIPGREVCRRTQWVQVVAYIYDAVGQDIRCAQTAQIVAAILRAAPEIVVDGDTLPISEPCEKHGPFPMQDSDLPRRPRYQVNLTWTVQSVVTP
jgi:hypothetical protein